MMFIVNFAVKDLNGGIDKMTIEEAIEKQIPKRPAVLKIDELSGFKYGDCICGEHINDDENYYSNCGQRIDWDCEENK